MKNRAYQLLISLVIVFIAILSNSCNLNAPVEIELVNVSVENLDFGLFTNEMEFTIFNTDTLDISYEISIFPGWITVIPQIGILEPGKYDTLKVIINRQGLDDGEYSGHVYVGLVGVTENIPVDITMQIKPIPVITPTFANLTETDSTASFSIINIGNNILRWRVNPLSPWLSANPDTGSTQPSTLISSLKDLDKKIMGTVSTFNALVDRNLLDPGLNVGMLEIESNIRKDTVVVSVQQSEEPVLSVSTTSLNFTSTQTIQLVTVDNTGEGILNWQASSPDSWVEIEPNTGTVTSEAAYSILSKYKIIKSGLNIYEMQVAISVNISELGPGDYQSVVNFTSNGGNASIDINLSIDTAPQISVTPTELNFRDNLNSLDLNIENIGTGELIWQIESVSQPWIFITIVTGSTSNNESILVEVNRAGLDPGPHSGEIRITSNGGNVTVPVSLTVGQQPELDFNPLEFNFNQNHLSDNLSLGNTGGGTLVWQAVPNVGWLLMSSDSGSTTIERETITVSVDQAVTLGPGVHEGEINISSNGGSGRVLVNYNIDSPAELIFTPSEFNFDKNNFSDILYITNGGSEPLQWNAAPQADWILISVDTGTTTFETDEIIVTVDTSVNLTPGTYHSTIDLTSNGGNAAVDVSVVVDVGPILEAAPVTLDFGLEISSLPIEISNIGSETLNWNIVKNDNWVSVDLGSGSIEPNQSSTVNIDVNRELLEPGIHTTNIEVTSNGGSQNIEIMVEIPVVSVIGISETVITFNAAINEKSFTVINEGNEDIVWSTSIEYRYAEITRTISESGWLTITPDNGVTKTTTEVVLSVDRSYLAAGEYKALIHVTSNFGNADIDVIMFVESPMLDIDPISLDFGTALNELSFGIKNIGGGQLDWYTSIEYLLPEVSPWLQINPSFGNTPNYVDINASVERLNLPSGVYEAIIHITSNGGNADVNVQMTIQASSLYVSPLMLDFGSSTTQMTFEVQNTGGGTLNYNITTQDNWISVSPAGGSLSDGTDYINVDVDRSKVFATLNQQKRDINSGTEIRGTIQIQNIDDQFNHETVEVIMTIIPPQIGVDPLLLDFGETETELTFDIKNVGSGTLNYSFWTEDYWISLSQYSGSVGSVKDVITVNVSRGTPPSDPGLNKKNAGNKSRRSSGTDITGYINIDNVDNESDKQVIEVRMIQPDPPILWVSTNTLEYAAGDETLQFQIKNLGEAPLEWWINIYETGIKHLDRANATITTETSLVNVTIDRALAPGNYCVIIYIGSNGGYQEVTATWTIPAS